jgi:hypothetical protein
LVAFITFIKCEIGFIDILENQYKNKANKKVKKNGKKKYQKSSNK